MTFEEARSCGKVLENRLGVVVGATPTIDGGTDVAVQDTMGNTLFTDPDCEYIFMYPSPALPKLAYASVVKHLGGGVDLYRWCDGKPQKYASVPRFSCSSELTMKIDLYSQLSP